MHISLESPGINMEPALYQILNGFFSSFKVLLVMKKYAIYNSFDYIDRF